MPELVGEVALDDDRGREPGRAVASKDIAADDRKARLRIGALAYGFGAIVVGFQLLAFAVFTKVFAITEGLLPEIPPESHVRVHQA